MRWSRWLLATVLFVGAASPADAQVWKPRSRQRVKPPRKSKNAPRPVKAITSKRKKRTVTKKKRGKSPRAVAPRADDDAVIIEEDFPLHD